MTDRRIDPISVYLLLGAVGFLLVASRILSITPPADGFEFSVYRGYPVYFWIVVILGFFFAQLVVVRRALLVEDSITVPWRPALLVVVVFESFLFLLPYFRGYASYDRADVLTHIGFIKNIHQYGAVPPGDIYPNIHLLTLTFSYATGIKPMGIINAISVVVPLFSVVSWYALISRLFDRRPALLTLPFAMLLIGGSAFTNPSPFAQSMLLVPFVLYVFVREQQTQTTSARIVLAITLVAIVVYHPLTTVFLLTAFVIYWVVLVVKQGGSLTGSSTGREALFSSKAATQLVAGVFLSWYYQFTPIQRKTRSTIAELLGTTGGESQLSSYSSTVSEASPRVVDIVSIALSDYGISAAYLGLGGLYIGKRLYESLTDRMRSSVMELTAVATFALFAAASVLFFIQDLVVGFGRPLLFSRLFGVLLVGVLFHDLYRRFERPPARHAVTLFLCFCLLSTAVFGVADLYHSPMKAEASHQVTHAEVDGTTWVLDHRNRYLKHVEHGITLARFGDAYYGKQKASDRQRVRKDAELPPARFTYDGNVTLGPYYEEDRYLLIPKRGREFYPNVYPNYRDEWKFYPEDYDQLKRDWTVSHLYDNGEVEVYRVYADDT